MHLFKIYSKQINAILTFVILTKNVPSFNCLIKVILLIIGWNKLFHNFILLIYSNCKSLSNDFYHLGHRKYTRKLWKSWKNTCLSAYMLGRLWFQRQKYHNIRQHSKLTIQLDQEHSVMLLFRRVCYSIDLTLDFNNLL